MGRFEDLDRKARTADLEIETTALADIDKIDTSALTVGQLIVLANFVEAVRLLEGSEYDTGQGNAGVGAFLSPATAERRDGAPDYAGVKVPTVNGPVDYQDIPRDEDGHVPASWIEENCTCDDHEKARIDAAKESDDTIARGLYL